MPSTQTCCGAVWHKKKNEYQLLNRFYCKVAHDNSHLGVYGNGFLGDRMGRNSRQTKIRKVVGKLGFLVAFNLGKS